MGNIGVYGMLGGKDLKSASAANSVEVTGAAWLWLWLLRPEVLNLESPFHATGQLVLFLTQ